MQRPLLSLRDGHGNLLEAIHYLPVPFNLAEEHGFGTDPELMIAVHGLIDDEVLQGFAVLGDAHQAVLAALEMTIVLFHGPKVNHSFRT